MRRVAGQEQPSVAHRLGNETPERGNRFLDRGTCDNLVCEICRETCFELFPETLIRPIIKIGVEWALNIVPAEHRTAHGRQRKAPFMVGVYDFGQRGRFRQNAEPSEGIYFFEQDIDNMLAVSFNSAFVKIE